MKLDLADVVRLSLLEKHMAQLDHKVMRVYNFAYGIIRRHRQGRKDVRALFDARMQFIKDHGRSLAQLSRALGSVDRGRALVTLSQREATVLRAMLRRKIKYIPRPQMRKDGYRRNALTK